MSKRRSKKSTFKAVLGALTKMNKNMHKGLSTKRRRRF